MKKESKTVTRAERHANMEGVRPWRGGEGGPFTSEDIAGVRTILDSVAAEFSDRFSIELGVELGLSAEITVSGCEEFTGGGSTEFAREDGFAAAAVLSGRAFAESRIHVHCETRSAIGLVEHLMGGRGPSASIARPLTEGERAVLHSVHETFCRSLENALGRVLDDLAVRPMDSAALPTSAKATDVPDAADTVLVATFDVLSGATAQLKLVLPHRLALRLVREWPTGSMRLTSRRRSPERLRATLLDCAYTVALELPPVPVKASDLTRLKVGEVLVLSHNIDDAGVLCAGGRAIFTAFPVRNRERRAAQLDQRRASH